MKDYNDIITIFNNDNKARIILGIDNEDIKFFEINSKGKIVRSGERIKRIEYDSKGRKKIRYEDGDTFQDTYVDLKSIKVGECPKISFNKKIYEPILHIVNGIKESN